MIKTMKAETPPSQPETGEKLVGADRVLGILLELANHPEGIALDDLVRIVKSPKPTVHRALSALRRAGLAALDGPGHYALGDEFIRLAFAHHEARPSYLRVQPALQALAQRFSETAHFGVLDGQSIVYQAKVDPAVGAVKLTSTIGGRNPAHSTAIGKLLLSFTLTDREAVDKWIGGQPLARLTPHTKTTTDELHKELELTRELGYGIDDQENELQINCVAIPIFLTSPSKPDGAISISAMAYRTPLGQLREDIPEIKNMLTANGLMLAQPPVTSPDSL